MTRPLPLPFSSNLLMQLFMLYIYIFDANLNFCFYTYDHTHKFAISLTFLLSFRSSTLIPCHFLMLHYTCECLSYFFPSLIWNWIPISIHSFTSMDEQRTGWSHIQQAKEWKKQSLREIEMERKTMWDKRRKKMWAILAFSENAQTIHRSP